MFELLVIGFSSGIVTALILIAYTKYRAYQMHMKLKRYAEDVLEAFEERVVPARIEFESNQMLCYNRDTDEFLAQATTWDELNDILKSRFPDKMFDVPQDQINKAQVYVKPFKGNYNARNNND